MLTDHLVLVFFQSQIEMKWKQKLIGFFQVLRECIFLLSILYTYLYTVTVYLYYTIHVYCISIYNTLYGILYFPVIR